MSSTYLVLFQVYRGNKNITLRYCMMKYCALITASGDKTERSTLSNLSRTEFIDVFVDFNVETCFFFGVSSSSINGFRESSLFLAGGG